MSPGFCSRVQDFTAGRVGYGCVKFIGETDVRWLNLDQIIKFNRCEIIAYEDESSKPVVGQGLNKLAEVSILLQAKSFNHCNEDCLRKLKCKTESQGAQLISFDPINDKWKFLVQHFSRFGLSEDDEEDIMMNSASPDAQDLAEMIDGEVSDIDNGTAPVDPTLLSHSLPAHLGLDPVKMREMRMLMFPPEEEDIQNFNDVHSWWGPNGVLVHCGMPVGSTGYQNVLSSMINLEKVAIDKVTRDENNKICRSNIGIIERQLEVPHLSYASRGLLMHQVMEALPLMRRAESSCWLQESIYHRVQEEVSSLNEFSDLEHIFLLLTGRQMDDAVELAAFRGNIRLACLLSQAGGSTANCAEVAHQLDLWSKNGMDFNFIEEERVRLLELLSGNIHGALHGVKIDWKRFLGLLMWYQLPLDTSLPDVFNTYQMLVNDGRAPNPVPVYIDEDPIEEDTHNWETVERFNLAYHLMLLHARQENDFGALKTMFSALASTNDPLDYHMIWHQRVVLKALLCLGKCHWAIYVVPRMPHRENYPYLQATVIREILFQYREVWSTDVLQQQFIEKLDIPSAWLHEALAS
ncbi:nuclear pore complex NUP96 [Olea europaea subsp. europaea]|uniref:Nuclear pore complex NUP96 n=1 Tax=Olea europaea subsp. europaea TaxID=158383 RepID=A0A8S0V0V1_OLEEU|nr:nuclear pore complex NUP96 [Olea europaea subsp. europaea]